MQDLNKPQLILLALLVSFVTSIATGIVTVTLMDQAPADITRTIDRVVEKTVEKVVPGETRIIEKIHKVEAGPTRDELVVAAVEKNSAAMGKIITAFGEGRTTFFVTGGGLLVTTANGLDVGSTYGLLLLDKKPRDVNVLEVDEENNLALLKVKPVPATETESEEEKPKESNEKFNFIETSKETLALGQTVIGVGTRENASPTVSLGIISGIRSGSASTTPRLYTNIEVGKDNVGGPLLSLEGELIGVNISGESVASGSKSTAIPVNVIRNFLSSYLKLGQEENSDDNVANVSDALPLDETN